MPRTTTPARPAIAAVLAVGTVLAAIAAPASAAMTPDSTRATPSATVATPASSAQPDAAGVSGTAQVHYAYSPDDDIRFTFDAHATPFAGPAGTPTDAEGTFRFAHRVAATGESQWAAGEVVCLMTAGPTATLTGRVTHASSGVQDWIGDRLGFSVYDGGSDHRRHSRDRMGFSWGLVDAPEPAGCMAPAPFTTVTRGGFAVEHVEPALPE